MGAAPEFEVVLDIDGMTCASCVDRIERVLRRQDCVADASVSLASRSATVRSLTADPTPLIDAVHRAGYGARVRTRRAERHDEVRDYQRWLIVAAFCSFYVLLLSLLLGADSHAAAAVGWLFATPVQFYAGWPFLRTAARAARHGTHTMDTLIACGSLAAYGYSTAVVLSGGHQVYFDTAVMIVTLVLLGKVLEARARARAGDVAQLLLERQATEATVLEDGRELRVPVEKLRPGQRVVVLPGETFPPMGRWRPGSPPSTCR
jgi:Cu+-exporting ATPase